MRRRRLFHLAAHVALIGGSLTVISAVQYVVEHPGNSVQQNLASWARNQGMGRVVDAMEAWLHDQAPSTTPANSLALVDEQGGDAPASPVTTTTLPSQPPTIAPRIVPALANEGVFRPIQNIRGRNVLWAASLRPLGDYGSVVATVVVFDPRDFRTAMFNGTETPGGGPWVNGKRVMKAARPALVATFNGGFRFEHKPGGYVTEDTTVRKLQRGYATLAINSEGVATVGVLGEDIDDDGTWVTLRQNLPPVVKDGVSFHQNYKWISWGKDFDNKIYNFRSAVCMRTDGLMSFVAVGDVNIDMLARTLIAVGCKTGMELDINGTWPQFATYSGFGTASRWGKVVDTRMGNPNRFLNESTKDFFALFDPLTLPEGVVR